MNGGHSESLGNNCRLLEFDAKSQMNDGMEETYYRLSNPYSHGQLEGTMSL